MGVVGGAFTHIGDAIARTEPKGTYMSIVCPTSRQEYQERLRDAGRSQVTFIVKP